MVATFEEQSPSRCAPAPAANRGGGDTGRRWTSLRRCEGNVNVVRGDEN
jgi:hypothetical protein